METSGNYSVLFQTPQSSSIEVDTTLSSDLREIIDCWDIPFSVLEDDSSTNMPMSEPQSSNSKSSGIYPLSYKKDIQRFAKVTSNSEDAKGANEVRHLKSVTTNGDKRVYVEVSGMTPFVQFSTTKLRVSPVVHGVTQGAILTYLMLDRRLYHRGSIKFFASCDCF